MIAGSVLGKWLFPHFILEQTLTKPPSFEEFLYPQTPQNL